MKARQNVNMVTVQKSLLKLWIKNEQSSDVDLQGPVLTKHLAITSQNSENCGKIFRQAWGQCDQIWQNFAPLAKI